MRIADEVSQRQAGSARCSSMVFSGPEKDVCIVSSSAHRYVVCGAVCGQWSVSGQAEAGLFVLALPIKEVCPYAANQKCNHHP